MLIKILNRPIPEREGLTAFMKTLKISDCFEYPSRAPYNVSYRIGIKIVRRKTDGIWCYWRIA